VTDLKNALWIELRKAFRSRVPLFTLIGFMILPLACALMMFIYKDPEFARKIGLLGAKANLVGGSADWPFYLSMLAQGVAGGGMILNSLIISWVFGREFSDGTLKDMLAVPVLRSTLLGAKFILFGLWSLILMTVVYLTGLALGVFLGLPLGSPDLFWRGSVTVIVAACLAVLAIFPVALFASLGRGYLLSIGLVLLLMGVANVIAILGYGTYFPLSVPMLYASSAGKGVALEPVSFWIVICTGLAGVGVTLLWWQLADQSR
jgi:ABC-2 type transport system permease protein